MLIKQHLRETGNQYSALQKAGFWVSLELLLQMFGFYWSLIWISRQGSGHQMMFLARPQDFKFHRPSLALRISRFMLFHLCQSATSIVALMHLHKCSVTTWIISDRNRLKSVWPSVPLGLVSAPRPMHLLCPAGCSIGSHIEWCWRDFTRYQSTVDMTITFSFFFLIFPSHVTFCIILQSWRFQFVWGIPIIASGNMTLESELWISILSWSFLDSQRY